MASVQQPLDFPVRKTRSQCKLRSNSKENDKGMKSDYESPGKTPRTRRQLFCENGKQDDRKEIGSKRGTEQKMKKQSSTSQEVDSESECASPPKRQRGKLQSSTVKTPKLMTLKSSDIFCTPPKPLKENNELTPKMAATPGKLHLSKPDLSPYQKAKKALHTSIPLRLVCREREMSDMSEFLNEHLSRKKSGSLYMYGNPGTGKTACLTHLLEEKQASCSFKSIFINCMSMKNPVLVYRKVAAELDCTAGGSNQDILSAIEKKLCKQGPMCILVLDEIDQLESRNQEVLYTIFEWSRMKSSHLILIGIANTLDLTNRVLPRLQSLGCEPACLKFNPYTKDQIVTILEDRLKEVQYNGIPVIKPLAIQMCAKKIASCTGDIRRALDMCRRAIEVMEADIKDQKILQVTCDDRSNPGSPKKSPSKLAFKQVDIPHIVRIINQVYGSRVLSSGLSNNEDISNTLPLQEKILICSLLLLKKHTKSLLTVGKVQDVYSRICKKREISNFGHSEFFNTCSLLECKGLISLKRHKETRLSKITLCFDDKEAEHVLKDKLLLSTVLVDVSVLSK